MAKPFVKWAGGKTQLIEEILARRPAEFDRFVEPMVGGGDVLFSVLPKQSLISDINSELINAYIQIRDNVDEVINHLSEFEQNADTYYSVRAADRSESIADWTPGRLAARTIYLNKLGYNGLYRVNASGQFNVPYGKRTNVIFNADELRSSSRALASCSIMTGSYLDLEQQILPQDWVYLDPPYVPLDETSRFTEYTAGGFSWDKHIELKGFCDRLTERGIKFLLSNSHTRQVLELYSQYNISVVFAKRSINADGSGRGRIPEVIIANY
jgi:DNA adenine methylase